MSIHRNSKQRELIYNLVMASDKHPTAEDIYSEAKIQMPSLSLGTVYRNLHLLAGEGRLKQVVFEGSQAVRFEGMTEDHEHFICTHCGLIRNIEPTVSRAQHHIIASQLGVSSVASHSLTYFGLCNDCGSNENKE